MTSSPITSWEIDGDQPHGIGKITVVFDGIKIGVIPGNASGNGIILLILQFIQTIAVQIGGLNGDDTGAADDGKHQ